MLRFALAMLRRDAEVWSGLTALLWATFAVISAESLAFWPSMRVLLHVGDDRMWRAIAFSIGSAQFIFALLGSSFLRWAAAFAACWFWGALTFGTWAGSSVLDPAAAVYLGWCGINVFVILRLIPPIRRYV